MKRAGESPNLPRSPTEVLSATLDSPAPGERPGTVIGPYKLLQQIGEGGMGTVFMAEQIHPVRRKVAVKLMRGELDWIVMKALEKDRNRRYETVNGFAADLQRYLSATAISVRWPSFLPSGTPSAPGRGPFPGDETVS